MLTAAGTELPPWLQASGVGGKVVSVRVYKDDRLSAEGAGVVVSNEGDVLTSAAVLDAGPNVTVIGSDTVELAAVVQLKEKDSGLGILKVEGLSSNALPLSVETPASGIRIFSVPLETTSGEASVVAGAIGEVEIRNTREGENFNLLQHNAMITARWYGSPVIDECGRIVALNIPDPQAFSLFRSPRNNEPKDVVFALSAEYLVSRLESLEIEFVGEDVACVSALVRAQQRAQEAQQAQERVQQAEERLQQAEAEVRRAGEQVEQVLEQAEQSQSQMESAREEVRLSRESEEQAKREAAQARLEVSQASERAVQAETEVERAEMQLAEAQYRLAEGRRSAERLRRLTVWGGASGVLLLLVILASWLTFARRRKRDLAIAQARAAGAEWEAAEAKQRADEKLSVAPFDCVLMGVDSAGSPLALNLRREVLGSSTGAVIGRSPAGSGHVVADPDVSREHLRIYVEDGVPYAEDLNSTNGSTLNGHALMPGNRSQINDGDELKLGTVSFRIYLKA